MAEKACAVSAREKPAARSVPMTVSWWCSVAGPGAVREETSAIAQGCRLSAARAEIARSRIAVRHALVEGHRLDGELFAEPAHGQRLDALRVGERDGGAQHPLAPQRDARRHV